MNREIQNSLKIQKGPLSLRVKRQMAHNSHPPNLKTAFRH